MRIRVRRLVPLAATPAATTGAARALLALTRLRPGSQGALRAIPALEHRLHRLLAGGGIRALEAVVRSAPGRGVGLQLDATHRGYRAWTCSMPRGVLRVTGRSPADFRFISVTWTALPKPLTAPQRAIHNAQQAFYARYMVAGRRAYATPHRRISAVDRVILLIGELEADVNNGGFAQYLDNKGRRRAKEALRALRRIGARTTAALLAAALKPAAPPATLSRLDDRFYAMREDIARLATRKFGLTGEHGS